MNTLTEANRDISKSAAGGMALAPAVGSLIRILNPVNTVILKVCRIGMVGTLFWIFLIVCLNVFFRYVLNNALVWAEEIAKFSMVWLCFLGSPVVLHAGGHVAIETLPDRCSGHKKSLLIVLGQIILLSIMGLLLVKGIELSLNALPQHSTAVPWLSIFWVYLAMPLGSLLMIPVSMQMGLECILKNWEESC